MCFRCPIKLRRQIVAFRDGSSGADKVRVRAHCVADTFVADGRNGDLLFCFYRAVTTHYLIKQPYEIVRLRSTQVWIDGDGAYVPYGLCASLRGPTQAGRRQPHADMDAIQFHIECNQIHFRGRRRREIGERLRIDVWDTGAGISPLHQDAIFAEYYQIDNPVLDRSKGLGLGLSIVHRVIGILPKHSMSFWSVEGRGSRFSLYAPISQMAPVVVTEDQTNAARTSILKGKYIVLCDDDPTVLEGLRRLFLSAGALVDSAEPFVLLRKSSTPESTLAEVSRLVADRQPTGSRHVLDP